MITLRGSGGIHRSGRIVWSDASGLDLLCLNTALAPCFSLRARPRARTEHLFRPKNFLQRVRALSNSAIICMPCSPQPTPLPGYAGMVPDHENPQCPSEMDDPGRQLSDDRTCVYVPIPGWPELIGVMLGSLTLWYTIGTVFRHT
jgi:hypothetical protein